LKIHELEVTSAKDRKRVGRGIGSGRGKTAGRGTKGQNARTGGGVRPGFEGGQNPLAKRLPKKRGFVPISRVEYQLVSLAELESLTAGSTADASTLASHGFIKHVDRRVKLLANGTLTKKLTVKVHGASQAAIAAVEKAGGSLEVIKLAKTPSKKATRPKVEETTKI
jgi:large subunit ribosomal protein L15